MQGLAFAAGKPLMGVSALDALARIGRKRSGRARIATWVDAWRGEVYAALYEGGREIEAPMVASPDELLAGSRQRADLLHRRRCSDVRRSRFIGAWGRRARIAAMPTPLLAGTIAILGGRARPRALLAATCDSAPLRATNGRRTCQGLACPARHASRYWIDRLDGDQDLDGVLVVEVGVVHQPLDARDVCVGAAEPRRLPHLRRPHVRSSGRRLLRVLAGRRRDSHQQRGDPARTCAGRGSARR